MSKIISIRINDIDEYRINEIKKYYKNNFPFKWEYKSSEIIKTAIATLYYELYEEKSNKSDI